MVKFSSQRQTYGRMKNPKITSKEFHDVFTWSYKEIPGFNPRIVAHEIKTYPNAKPV